jgi:hypothetical protein
MHNETNTEAVKKYYPSIPAEDGFFYESEDEEALKIETKIHENGNKTKKTILQNGKVAIVRELSGRDTKAVTRFVGKDEERFQTAGITIATTIDGKPETFEFFEGLKWKDSNRLLMMFSELNF